MQAFEHMPNEKTENAKKLWLMLVDAAAAALPFYSMVCFSTVVFVVGVAFRYICSSSSEVEHPTLSNENMKTQRRVESA